MGSKRSKFEEYVGIVLEESGFTYETLKVPYTTSSTYIPDWSLGNVLVEAKGWFRPGDTKKYKAIHKTLEAKGVQELVFLLQYPNKPVRKGSKITMSGWCNKEGIAWFSAPEDIVKYYYHNGGV